MASERLLLLDCLDIDDQTRVIALVGAGGKTSLMYLLAREMGWCGEWIVTTTTTKIRPPEPGQSPLLILVDEDPELKDLPSSLCRFGHITIGRSLQAEGKVEGVSEEIVKQCLEWATRIVIEADGANGRSIKAPESWEPVIPSVTDLVVPIIGLDCVGRPAAADCVFRLERFLEVTGLRENEIITPDAIARIVTHPEGALKGVPEKARVVPFLNKEDRLQPPWTSHAVADAVLTHAGNRIRRVVVGQLKEGIRARAYTR